MKFLPFGCSTWSQAASSEGFKLSKGPRNDFVQFLLFSALRRFFKAPERHHCQFFIVFWSSRWSFRLFSPKFCYSSGFQSLTVHFAAIFGFPNAFYTPNWWLLSVFNCIQIVQLQFWALFTIFSPIRLNFSLFQLFHKSYSPFCSVFGFPNVIWAPNGRLFCIFQKKTQHPTSRRRRKVRFSHISSKSDMGKTKLSKKFRQKPIRRPLYAHIFLITHFLFFFFSRSLSFPFFL